LASSLAISVLKEHISSNNNKGTDVFQRVRYVLRVLFAVLLEWYKCFKEIW